MLVIYSVISVASSQADGLVCFLINYLVGGAMRAYWYI